MTAVILNQVGLVFGILGVVVIFVWGPPVPNLEEGISLGLEDETPLSGGQTVPGHNKQVRRRRKKHRILSGLGLALLGLGFVCQFLATLARSIHVEGRAS